MKRCVRGEYISGSFHQGNGGDFAKSVRVESGWTDGAARSWECPYLPIGSIDWLSIRLGHTLIPNMLTALHSDEHFPTLRPRIQVSSYSDM